MKNIQHMNGIEILAKSVEKVSHNDFGNILIN